jgi:hypothetical protein
MNSMVLIFDPFYFDRYQIKLDRDRCQIYFDVYQIDFCVDGDWAGRVLGKGPKSWGLR